MPLAIMHPASLAIPRFSHRSLSSFTAIASPDHFRLATFFPIVPASDFFSPATIRMGGGPRTFPGGVSKWQWKRMQAKKAKQLLKARLCRERQLYEMRKRAELKAAISELERPWEVVERAPVLFSASADEQVKALADRFQRPDGFDMWSEKDGPRIFRSPDDGLSVQFFRKGAIHSVRPYGLITEKAGPDGLVQREEETTNDDWTARAAGGMGRAKHARPSSGSSSSEKLGQWIVGTNRGSYGSDLESALGVSSEEEGGGGSGDGGSNSGHGRRHKMLGRANLRPTTELTMEEAVAERRDSKGRERGDTGFRSGHGRWHKMLGRANLRPTTELRMEEAVAERRDSRGRERGDTGFRSGHGRGHKMLGRANLRPTTDLTMEEAVAERRDSRGRERGDTGFRSGHGRGHKMLGRANLRSTTQLTMEEAVAERRDSKGRKRGDTGFRSGHGRGHKMLGRVNLRPTTELRVEEGVAERRSPKGREGDNTGFWTNRAGGTYSRRRSPEGS